MPVTSLRKLIGMISFCDVAEVVVASQDFENRMLKVCIRDGPVKDKSVHSWSLGCSFGGAVRSWQPKYRDGLCELLRLAA